MMECEAVDMKNYINNMPAPFLPIKSVVKFTGLSEFFIRRGISAGTIAHVKSGNKIMVNVPALLSDLDEESRKQICGR